MSQQLEVSMEDLEKAASVRLFEKVAAANDIDLNQLSGEQISSLYTDFETNVLPKLAAGEEEEKTAEALEAEAQAKLASLTPEQVVGLFEKQAASEGLEPTDWDDEQLKIAFAYFADNVLPIMAYQDFEPVTPAQAEKIAQVQEVQTKIAEADELGRIMARAFYNESQKLAGATVSAGSGATRVPQALQHAANWVGANKGKAGLIGAGGLAVAGGTALAAKKVLGGKKEASVTLNAGDLEILEQISASGDVEGLKVAAAAILKAASDDKDEDDKGGDKDKEDDKDKGGEKKMPPWMKDKEAEKKASAAFNAVDALVEQRATELAESYLRENGLLK